MGLSRYSFSQKIKDGQILATTDLASRINRAVNGGFIKFSTYVISEGERLDHMATRAYNDPSYWWVIAAASGIGWGLQVPPGTILRIPTNLGDVLGLIS